MDELNGSEEKDKDKRFLNTLVKREILGCEHNKSMLSTYSQEELQVLIKKYFKHYFEGDSGGR